MQLFIIFQILFKLFVCNKGIILHNFLEKNIIYNFKYDCNEKIFFMSQNKSSISCIKNFKKITKTDDYNLDFIRISHDNIHIPLTQYKYKTHLVYKNNNKNNLRIQIENNSINMLHIFDNKHSENMLYKRMLYFYQCGIRNAFSSDQTVTIGIGKRYCNKDQYGIGYNTIVNLPILNHYMHLPYSLNIGGECWYHNVIFILNGYYNLNRILYSNNSSRLNVLENPVIGYQVYVQSILPYIYECRTQIKLEKLFYKNKQNRLFNYLDQDNSYSLSIGIRYKPIPMLEISVDNVFINKKYINTLFKVALNYQFNAPINNQIKQKHHNNLLLNVNYLDSVLKPFLPENITTSIHDDTCDISKITHRIIGYSKEIKYIKIHHNAGTSLKWNTESLEESGGKIVYLKDNLYKIHLPKYVRSRNNQVIFSYEEQNEKNIIQNKKTILVVVEKFLGSQNMTMTQDNSIITIENIQDVNNSNNIDLVEHNSSNQNINNVFVINSNNQQDNALSITHGIAHDKSQKVSAHSSSNDNNLSFFIPIPPPEPKLPLFPHKITEHVSSDNLSCSLSKQEIDSDQKAIDTLLSKAPKKAVLPLQQGICPISHTDSNITNLTEQLLITRQTKFSSIGTKEYIANLESTIMERKKINYVTDIGRMFNKLHDSLSYSSIEDTWDTDDNTDSFSESSKN